jgi:hypothetical protein
MKIPVCYFEARIIKELLKGRLIVTREDKRVQQMRFRLRRE